MGVIDIFLISIGLGMDSCAVSICKGLSMKKMDWKKALIIGAYFGGFQALMPLIGYGLGLGFENIIKHVDHWIAFGLLLIIGGNMIKEAFSNENNAQDDSVNYKIMIVLAIATSIDALAIGITFAFFKINIIASIILIGIVAFILSVIGVKIGNIFGNRYGKITEIIGGIILILIGVKILLEHLNFG